MFLMYVERVETGGNLVTVIQVHSLPYPYPIVIVG